MKRGSLDPALILSTRTDDQLSRPRQLTSSSIHTHTVTLSPSSVHRAATESHHVAGDFSVDRAPRHRIAPIQQPQQQQYDNGRRVHASDRRSITNTAKDRRGSDETLSTTVGTGTKQFKLAPSSSVLQELAEQLVPRHKPPLPAAATLQRRLRSSCSEEVCKQCVICGHFVGSLTINVFLYLLLHYQWTFFIEKLSMFRFLHVVYLCSFACQNVIIHQFLCTV